MQGIACGDGGGYTGEVSESQIMSKAQLAAVILVRVDFLGMGQNAFVATTGLNLSDLLDLVNGNDNEITVEQLQEALETVKLSDSGREIVDLKAGKVAPVVKAAEGEKAPPTIGERIRARRLELGLYQSDLADRLDVSNSLVGMWETNRTRVMADDIARLAEALKTTRGYFVGEGVSQVAERILAQTSYTDDVRKPVLNAIFDEMTNEQKDALLITAIQLALRKS